MPTILVCPTSDPSQLVSKIESITPRLNGIMSALRSECLHVVSAIYREIPTRETPVLTDLLHGFQEGDREELSDLRLDFPDIPEECFEVSPEINDIGGSYETPDIYHRRLWAAVPLSQKLGRNVVIVAPSHVIKHLTGVTLPEGDVLVWNFSSS